MTEQLCIFDAEECPWGMDATPTVRVIDSEVCK
jgi:hypothetical protein